MSRFVHLFSPVETLLLEQGALPPKFSKFCPIYLILYHLNMLVKEKATNNESNETIILELANF